jgi:hypothetical protein
MPLLHALLHALLLGKRALGGTHTHTHRRWLTHVLRRWVDSGEAAKQDGSGSSATDLGDKKIKEIKKTETLKPIP